MSSARDLGRADDEGPDIALPRPADPTQAHVRIRPHVRLGGRGVTGAVGPPRGAGGHKFPLLIRDGAAPHPEGQALCSDPAGPRSGGDVLRFVYAGLGTDEILRGEDQDVPGSGMGEFC
jgi:hypothetical protein